MLLHDSICVVGCEDLRTMIENNVSGPSDKVDKQSINRCRRL